MVQFDPHKFELVIVHPCFYDLYMIAGLVEGFTYHLVELIFEVECCLQKADG